MKTIKKSDAEEKIADLNNKYLRALADYQNLEKRVEAEKELYKDKAEETVVRKFLPVFVAFKKLKDHVKTNQNIDESLKQGVVLVFNQFNAVLEGYGFGKLDIKIGEEMFDPHKMECVEVVEGEDNKVLEEIQPGYTFRGRLIMAAQVKVGKKKVDQKEEELAKEQLQKGDYM